MKELTKKQRAVLGYVANRIARDEYVPSPREIADACELTPNGATYTLWRLEKKGFLASKSAPARVMVTLDLESLGRRSANPQKSPREA